MSDVDDAADHLAAGIGYVEEQQRTTTAVPSSSLTTTQARMLYASHALSTWNARSYEFAAIILTAVAFPDTLFYSSLRGLITTLFTLLLAGTVGSTLGAAPSRLRSLQLSIQINRATVVLCCFLWLALLAPSRPPASQSPGLFSPSSPLTRHALFALVILFGILERLSGIANMMIMERDWVPTVADSVTDTSAGGVIYTLTKLNATMRRIDLICKLFAPLVISAILESFASYAWGVLFLLATNFVGHFLEPWLARRVWNECERLQAPKAREAAASPSPTTSGETTPSTSPTRLHQHIRHFFATQYHQARAYFTTEAWIPSLSLALLYFSALSYSATFITWLLNSGFSLSTITIARAFGSVVEVSSTFVAPISIERLAYTKDRGRYAAVDEEELRRMAPAGNMPAEDGEADNDDDQDAAPVQRGVAERKHIVGLARSGLWAVTTQFLSLLPVVLAIFSITQSKTPSSPPSSPSLTLPTLFLRAPPTPSLLTALTLFTSLSLSRLGLWTFDLCVQELDQLLVPASAAASFAGTEAAFTSLFELGQWALVAGLSSPEMFGTVAVISVGSVAVSAAAFAGWVWRWRGHLVHWERVCGGKVGSGR